MRYSLPEIMHSRKTAKQFDKNFCSKREESVILVCCIDPPPLWIRTTGEAVLQIELGGNSRETILEG